MIRFSTLGPNGETNIRLIKQSDVMKCPHCILQPDHYREDGTCRCDDKTHAEMMEWGYKWESGAWK